MRDKQIEDKVKDITNSFGTELIDFRILPSRSNKTIKCLADYPEGGITIDTCARINKEIVSYLEENNILDDYIVEINSPGLDRPLKSVKDFLRVKGRPVSLWFNEPVCDKTSLEALVVGIHGDELVINYKDKILNIDFKKIKLGKERIQV